MSSLPGRRSDPDRDRLLRAGALTIELRARQARLDGRLLELTAKEFDLLAYLVARPGHVFSRDHLLRVVWQSTAEWQQAATVTEHVRRLRTKIETEPRRPQILRTVRGAGYRLDLPQDPHIVTDTAAPFAPGSVVHVDGRIVRADETAAAIFELGVPAELIGRQISELVSPAARTAALERMSLDGPGAQRRTLVIDLERVDGPDLTVEVTSTEFAWNGHRAQHVTFSPVRDLSTRLRRLVTGVLSEVTDAVIISDVEFHVRSWNEAAERLYGWSEPEVLGRHLLEVVQWAGDDHDVVEIRNSLERTSRWKDDGRQVTRDGSVIDVLACITLIRNDWGEPVAIVSVNRQAPAKIEDRSVATADLDDQICAGIANGEFEVYYQPVVALDDLRVVAMEALVRWNHPERGLLAPAAFIRTAEQCGSIVELGHIVIERSCAQAAEWRRSGRDVELAVNLSARQLSDPGLFDRISSVLASTGLDPAKLWLEVTETSLVEEVDQASAVLDRLAAIGVKIVIDDFGTGWASLTYLRSFPVHGLKIDRSFVAGIGSNAQDTAIARSILSLGAELGLHVTAEGIETPAQQKALRKLGCALAQGYLYGHPGPASTAPIHLAGRIAPHEVDPIHAPTVPRVVSTRPTPSALQAGMTPVRRLSIHDALAPVCDLANPDMPRPAARSRMRLADSEDRAEADITTRLLRGLLRITSAQDAAELLHATIRQLGGSLVPVAPTGEDALVLDVSLGQGPPLFVVSAPRGVDAEARHRVLAGITDDAQHAVDLIA